MSSSYRLELNKWLAQLDVKADRVLDIGGAQETMPPRVKSWDVKEYLIADLPNPHKDSPKPDIELDLNLIPGKSMDSHYGAYDLIFCLEVMEYIWNPFIAMVTIYGLLKDGAKAWITFPSFYPLHQPIEDDALRYMPAGIKKLAEAVGLRIVQMIPRRFETDAWQRTISAERMRAAKHEDHNFQGWIVELKK